jgi:hypothetical protein
VTRRPRLKRRRLNVKRKTRRRRLNVLKKKRRSFVIPRKKLRLKNLNPSQNLIPLLLTMMIQTLIMIAKRKQRKKSKRLLQVVLS